MAPSNVPPGERADVRARRSRCGRAIARGPPTGARHGPGGESSGRRRRTPSGCRRSGSGTGCRRRRTGSARPVRALAVEDPVLAVVPAVVCVGARSAQLRSRPGSRRARDGLGRPGTRRRTGPSAGLPRRLGRASPVVLQSPRSRPPSSSATSRHRRRVTRRRCCDPPRRTRQVPAGRSTVVPAAIGRLRPPGDHQPPGDRHGRTPRPDDARPAASAARGARSGRVGVPHATIREHRCSSPGPARSTLAHHDSLRGSRGTLQRPRRPVVGVDQTVEAILAAPVQVGDAGAVSCSTSGPPRSADPAGPDLLDQGGRTRTAVRRRTRRGPAQRAPPRRRVDRVPRRRLLGLACRFSVCSPSRSASIGCRRPGSAATGTECERRPVRRVELAVGPSQRRAASRHRRAARSGPRAAPAVLAALGVVGGQRRHRAGMGRAQLGQRRVQLHRVEAARRRRSSPTSQRDRVGTTR